MIGIYRKLVTGLFLLIAIPNVSSALVVDINGTSLTPATHGNPCIDITGNYPGFKITASEVGKIPQICFNARRHNHLEIHHATFLATGASLNSAETSGTEIQTGGAEQQDKPMQEIVITFSHDFPPGPNGVVTARAHLFGFFSTSTGLGSPTGNSVKFSGFLSQDNNYDEIAMPFVHSVGETMHSGTFEFGAIKKYLISADRTLKGVLSISFNRLGDKLTIPLATGVKLDLGSKFEKELDQMTQSKGSP